MSGAFPSASWTPLRVERDGRVRWCHTEGVAFDEPFFGDTIERCLRHPFRLLFQPTTTVDELVAYAAQATPVPIGGIVFHQSRCGSTLVAQMLAATPSYRVLSEPPAFDDVARTGDPRMIAAMTQALAQANPAPTRAFCKPDAWSTMQIGAITASLPDVPWIFLYRDPVELLESHARRFGGHTVPGAIPAEVFGLEPHDLAAMTPVEYAARVLARIGEAALAQRDDRRGRFVNYERLPEFVFDELTELWQLDLDPDALHDVAKRDAKNPLIAFDPARPTLRPAERDAVHTAAKRWLAPVYAELEAAQ